MNRVTKLALISLINYPLHLRTAFFHSTPVLDRRRSTQRPFSGGGRVRYFLNCKEVDEPPPRFREATWSMVGNDTHVHFYFYEYQEVEEFEDEDEDEDEIEDEDEDDSYILEIDSRKDRITLGLSGPGPLTLEDVKNAYRLCALKWHPDRHVGPSKATAEEKFKLCNAAYDSLCNKFKLANKFKKK